MRTSQIMAAAIVGGMTAAGCGEGTPTAAEPPVPSALEQLLTGWPGMNAMVSGDVAVPGGFTVEPLARGGFPDKIDATFRIKLNSRTTVSYVQDPSNVLVAKITFEPGGSIGWHTHPGPVIVAVASGALSIINASDCVHRVYAVNQAFVDPGQGNVHVGFNDTDAETIVYATFLAVPAGQPATVPAADPGCVP